MLFESILLLSVSTMKYIGYSDVIPTEVSDVQTIYNFNNEVDVNDLSSVFRDSLDSSLFIPISDNMPNLNIDILNTAFDSNLGLREKLLVLMKNETNYKRYRKLQEDYNLLFVTTHIQHEYSGFENYTGYLVAKNPNIQTFIDKLEDLKDDKSEMQSLIINLATTIENYIANVSL